MDIQEYRFHHINELTQQLKQVTAEYETKIQKQKTRIKKMNITMYTLIGIIAGSGSGIIVSSLIAIPAIPVAVMITISSGTSIAGIANMLIRKISTRRRQKINSYVVKLNNVKELQRRLNTLISMCLDESGDQGALVPNEEFTAIINEIKLTSESEISVESPIFLMMSN